MRPPNVQPLSGGADQIRQRLKTARGPCPSGNTAGDDLKARDARGAVRCSGELDGGARQAAAGNEAPADASSSPNTKNLDTTFRPEPPRTHGVTVAGERTTTFHSQARGASPVATTHWSSTRATSKARSFIQSERHLDHQYRSPARLTSISPASRPQANPRRPSSPAVPKPKKLAPGARFERVSQKR